MLREEAIERAEGVFNRLCENPDVWATHGMPNEAKSALIIAAIADEIERVAAGVLALEDAG